MQSSPIHQIQVMTLSFLLLIRRLRLAAGRTGQQQKKHAVLFTTSPRIRNMGWYSPPLVKKLNGYGETHLPLRLTLTLDTRHE